MDIKKKVFGIIFGIFATAETVTAASVCNETYNFSCMLATLYSELVSYMWLIAVVIIIIVLAIGLRYVSQSRKG